eukprot:s1994_g2.t1
MGCGSSASHSVAEAKEVEVPAVKADARAAELAPADRSSTPTIESSAPTKIEVFHEEAKDDGPAADSLIDTQDLALAQDVERPSALDSPRENNPAMAATSISLLSGASDIVADDIKEACLSSSASCAAAATPRTWLFFRSSRAGWPRWRRTYCSRSCHSLQARRPQAAWSRSAVTTKRSWQRSSRTSRTVVPSKRIRPSLRFQRRFR